MSMEPMPAPLQESLTPEHLAAVAATRVKAILDNLHAPIPTSIPVGKKAVSITDMVEAISAFRRQHAILSEVGSKWPAVLLQTRARDGRVNGTYWAPLNMFDRERGVADKFTLDKRHYSNGFIQRVTLKRAEESGFRAAAQEPDDMKKTFSNVIGKILSKRATTATNSGSAPPHAAFSVVTNTPNIEVMYATGYFVSTQQGFGFSTPALKSLPWGNYIFGTKIKSITTFSDTIWVVPLDNYTKLEV
jgi:hypothetical protein